MPLILINSDIIVFAICIFIYKTLKTLQNIYSDILMEERRKKNTLLEDFAVAPKGQLKVRTCSKN